VGCHRGASHLPISHLRGSCRRRWLVEFCTAPSFRMHRTVQLRSLKKPGRYRADGRLPVAGCRLPVAGCRLQRRRLNVRHDTRYERHLIPSLEIQRHPSALTRFALERHTSVAPPYQRLHREWLAWTNWSARICEWTVFARRQLVIATDTGAIFASSASDTAIVRRAL
jgi:hypothetical protein